MDRADPLATHGLGEIVGGLAGDVQDLVKGELLLARAEFDEKLHVLIAAAISAVGGALVAFAGLVVLLEGGAAALAQWMPDLGRPADRRRGDCAGRRPDRPRCARQAVFEEHHPGSNSRQRQQGRAPGKGAYLMVETTDTDAIERDLAKTRARMDHRLDELQVRLSPAQMINDALANFTGGDGAEFAQGVIAKIKVNPLPAALAGVGLAWLMASSSKPPVPAQPYNESKFCGASARG